MHYIGIDVGSTYTKYCIMNANREIIDLYSEKTPINQKQYFTRIYDDMQKRYGELSIVSCGYGRKNILAQKNINELSALSYGSYYIVPDINTILDIGGQDTKVVIEREGKLQQFFVNDKCAAGCGMFLANTLNLLKMDFTDINLYQYSEPRFSLSSTCAVFAQSEIVELIANDCDPKEIVAAVIWQILVQAKILLTKVECEKILLSGGMTQIIGIKEYAKKIFNREVRVLDNGVYFSAIGCAAMQIE